jgi:nitric oxide reductase NorD protein
MPSSPLTTAEIEAKLTESLDPILSPRRTANALARALRGFRRNQQELIMRWVEIIAKTNAELAFQFASRAPEALRVLSSSGIEDWIIHAMDVYDTNGLYPACAAIHDVKRFGAEQRKMSHAVLFSDIAGILELFVRGLSGRALEINTVAPMTRADGNPVSLAEAYTDTATLFLPARIYEFDNREDNYRLYKALTAHLWAQTRFATFLPPQEGTGLAELLRRFPDRQKTVRLFHALETVRLDACLARDLPGLHRDMTQLQNHVAPVRYPEAWEVAVHCLRQSLATVRDTYALLDELYPYDVPPPMCYQGVMFPERVDQAMLERVEREREEFRSALAEIFENLRGAPNTKEDEIESVDLQRRFRVFKYSDIHGPRHQQLSVTFDGKPVEPSARLKNLIYSIIQDFGQIPDDYLAGQVEYHIDQAQSEETRAGHYDADAIDDQNVVLYDEWDFRRKHYRKNWCALREIDVHPSKEAFAEATLEKYAGVLRSLRKTFEALRGEDRFLRKQMTGDDIDFDALVDGYADMRSGRELPQRLFMKRHKIERDIAVLFMVDMSGSTKGWINEAERESLILLCEALEVLGDRYAIYGFSGMTRKRCELYRIKRFDEPYSEPVRERIAGVKPQDYTRMGVIIRHLAKLFNDVAARTKLLITLSDGKPDDYDGYRGDYGIEDTRMALIEAKHAGIHPFCITIDTEAKDYLPHMYGAVNWTLVDNVRKLPVKVSEIYRKLTLS